MKDGHVCSFEGVGGSSIGVADLECCDRHAADSKGGGVSLKRKSIGICRCLFCVRRACRSAGQSALAIGIQIRLCFFRKIALSLGLSDHLKLIADGDSGLVVLYEGSSLINLYLTGEGTRADRASTLRYGLSYRKVMLAGLLFMAVQVFAGTLRECGETIIPMNAGLIAVFVNLGFNYVLIYGKLGFPKMGVTGSAVATVISRFVEVCCILMPVYRPVRFPYLQGLFSTWKIPAQLSHKIIVMDSPLLLNETLWAAGMAFLSQCYSVRGLNVVAASAITNLFNVVFISMDSCVAIIIGQKLGAGDMEDAKATAKKLIAISV